MGAQNWNLELAASDNNEKQLNSFPTGQKEVISLQCCQIEIPPVEYIDAK